MSTINAQNFGDGTDSVPASAVLEGTAKAWVFYDHTTPAVNDSYNISSVTDGGSGILDTNFANNFSADDEGAASGIQNRYQGTASNFHITSYVRFLTYGASGLQDAEKGRWLVWGSLA